MLIARLLRLVRACALPAPLLVCVDGFAAYVGQIRQMDRSPVPRRGKRGRPRLAEWEGLVIGQVIKQRLGRCVGGVTRRVAHSTRQRARQLCGEQPIHTAYIERLNGTFRARLSALTRRTHAAGRTIARREAGMWLVGTVYNFCTPHAGLAPGQTPAMAARVTDRVWSVSELLHYPVPPCPWQSPVRHGTRGRRPKELQALVERWVR